MTNKTWIGNAGDNDWSNTANWQGGLIATDGDSLYITMSGDHGPASNLPLTLSLPLIDSTGTPEGWTDAFTFIVTISSSGTLNYNGLYWQGDAGAALISNITGGGSVGQLGGTITISGDAAIHSSSLGGCNAIFRDTSIYNGNPANSLDFYDSSTCNGIVNDTVTLHDTSLFSGNDSAQCATLIMLDNSFGVGINGSSVSGGCLFVDTCNQVGSGSGNNFIAISPNNPTPNQVKSGINYGYNSSETGTLAVPPKIMQAPGYF